MQAPISPPPVNFMEYTIVRSSNPTSLTEKMNVLAYNNSWVVSGNVIIDNEGRYLCMMQRKMMTC